MTVTKKHDYSFPSPNSLAGSDVETLDVETSSEPESVAEQPLPNRIRIRKPKKYELPDLNNKRNLGKRKLRRYQDRRTLQTLNEDDEDCNNVAIMEEYKGPFARLLGDKTAYVYWQEFIEKSEEEQAKIIYGFTEKYSKETFMESSQFDFPGRISCRCKRTFKIRKYLSLELVQVYEEDVLNFFKTKQTDRYIKILPTSFDRLLIHAIAEYHRLKSISVIMDDGVQKSVEVYNEDKNWKPAPFFLKDFIRDLRNNS